MHINFPRAYAPSLASPLLYIIIIIIGIFSKVLYETGRRCLKSHFRRPRREVEKLHFLLYFLPPAAFLIHAFLVKKTFYLSSVTLLLLTFIMEKGEKKMFSF